MADQVEEVKQKTDIVSLIGERVKLVRAGRNFKALCPFHSERTPSFMVSSELQIFKCFGCGKSGDVYTFLQEFEGREFPDALAYLAQRAGVRLEPFRKGKDYQEKERLREVNHLASEYYHYLLASHRVGERARQYLAQRNIRKRAIETFKLGFAPDSWDSLIRFLVGKKRYAIEELVAAGLVIQSQRLRLQNRDYGHYDRFRNRVVFPLRDVRGNFVGFAGRVLPGEEEGSVSAEVFDSEASDRRAAAGRPPFAKASEGQAKYINSPETILYHKSEQLYGLFENKSAIKRQDHSLIVEGELDAISSWQAGVKAVVAVKGTALTSEQIALIRRYCRNISLALDADAAGDAATKRGIALADSASLNITVVLLEGGKDPDVIARENPNLWRQMARKTSNVYDYYIASARKRYDIRSGLGKKQASEELAPLLASITNAVEQAHYIKKVASLLDVSPEAVVDEVERQKRQAEISGRKSGPAQVTAMQQEEQRERRVILEEYLFALLLQGGKTALVATEGLAAGDFTFPAHRRIAELLFKRDAEQFEAGRFIGSLPAELRERAEAAFLRDLQEIIGDRDKLIKELTRVAEELRTLAVRRSLEELSEKIRTLEKAQRKGKVQQQRLAELTRRFSALSRQLSH